MLHNFCMDFCTSLQYGQVKIRLWKPADFGTSEMTNFTENCVVYNGHRVFALDYDSIQNIRHVWYFQPIFKKHIVLIFMHLLATRHVSAWVCCIQMAWKSSSVWSSFILCMMSSFFLFFFTLQNQLMYDFKSFSYFKICVMISSLGLHNLFIFLLLYLIVKLYCQFVQ